MGQRGLSGSTIEESSVQININDREKIVPVTIYSFIPVQHTAQHSTAHFLWCDVWCKGVQSRFRPSPPLPYAAASADHESRYADLTHNHLTTVIMPPYDHPRCNFPTISSVKTVDLTIPFLF